MEIELETKSHFSRHRHRNWILLKKTVGYNTLALEALFTEAPKLKMKREEKYDKNVNSFSVKGKIFRNRERNLPSMIFGVEKFKFSDKKAFDPLTNNSNQAYFQSRLTSKL